MSATLQAGPRPQAPGPARVRRRLVALMGFEVLTLAVMASLHLGGVLAVGTSSSGGRAAGTAEALIGVALAYAAVQLARNGPRAREIALGAVAFAIVGFLIGLSFTARGGDTVDLAYHAAMLPLLIATFALLLRSQRRGRRPAASAGGDSDRERRGGGHAEAAGPQTGEARTG